MGIFSVKLCWSVVFYTYGRHHSFSAKELAENSHVQDAFVIAVEQQAKERLERLSALRKIKPVDMTKLSQQVWAPFSVFYLFYGSFITATLFKSRLFIIIFRIRLLKEENSVQHCRFHWLYFSLIYLKSCWHIYIRISIRNCHLFCNTWKMLFFLSGVCGLQLYICFNFREESQAS